MKRGKFEIRQAQDLSWYWVLIAGNGEIVATGETHPTRFAAKRAANQIRWIAALARGA